MGDIYRGVMTVAEKYLARLGVAETAGADIDFLNLLIRRHVGVIPFENVTSFIDGPAPAGAISLDDRAIVEKLLGAVDGGPRRGGYCFEHAALLRLVLPELGFAVRSILGRVYIDPTSAPSAKTHNVTVVRFDGRDWLVDPGFGGLTPTAAIDLKALGQVQPTPHGDYRIVAADDVGINRALAPDVDVMLQVHIPGTDADAWVDLYALDLRTAAPIDLPALNWYVSTAPGATFTEGLALARAPKGERLTVANTTVKRHSSSGSQQRQLSTAEELGAALDEIGVDIERAEQRRLFDRVSAVTR